MPCLILTAAVRQQVISPKGLILTNHHCGYDNIQSHSSVEHDYLTDGFWAMKLEDELPNKDLFVTFIVRIEDVTNKVLEGVVNLPTEAEKQKKIQDNISMLNKTLPKESYQENSIRTFYDGNQYILFCNRNVPRCAFGSAHRRVLSGNSDRIRITGFGLVIRETSHYSVFTRIKTTVRQPIPRDNVPYKPKHFFPVSIKGIQENDFTMVMGYPGRTQEYLPSVSRRDNL